MPKIQAHAHKLKRHRYKSTGNAIYFCVLPDCNYKVDVPLTLGKKSVCWRCGKEFIMNEYSLRLAKPHCQNCHKTKDEYRNVIPEVKEISVTAIDEGTQSLRDRLDNLNNLTFVGKPDEGGDL